MNIFGWIVEVHPWIKRSRIGKVITLLYLLAACYTAWLGFQGMGILGALTAFVIGLLILQIAVVILSRVFTLGKETN